MPFSSKCHNSGNNGRNCTIFGAQGDLGRPFDFSTFDFGVTSRDLSMTLTVFKVKVIERSRQPMRTPCIFMTETETKPIKSVASHTRTPGPDTAQRHNMLLSPPMLLEV